MCRCNWCKCSEGEHDEYRKCPLLDGLELCDVCCDWDSQSHDPKTGRLEIVALIKRVIGKDLTDKEIEDICSQCYKKDWGPVDLSLGD